MAVVKRRLTGKPHSTLFLKRTVNLILINHPSNHIRQNHTNRTEQSPQTLLSVLTAEPWNYDDDKCFVSFKLESTGEVCPSSYKLVVEKKGLINSFSYGQLLNSPSA